MKYSLTIISSDLKVRKVKNELEVKEFGLDLPALVDTDKGVKAESNIIFVYSM